VHVIPPLIDNILNEAIGILGEGDGERFDLLDGYSIPIYATNADGLITYFNPACIAFAGRTPSINEDRWCVTWKLYTDKGTFLPHDRCPMAQALQNGAPVRGATAIAERPDGTRLKFMPYPTPLFNEDGRMAGAVNLFIDMTAQAVAVRSQERVAQCRRWMRAINDPTILKRLELLAAEFEHEARHAILASSFQPFPDG
jgi:PAS domain-containing protein